MPRFPQRSDLYWIPLEAEEDGEKERPVVIVSRDELNRGKLGRFNADQMAHVILAVRHAMRDPTAGSD